MSWAAEEFKGAMVHFHKVFVHRDRIGFRAPSLAPWTYRLAIAAVSVASLNCSAVSSKAGGQESRVNPAKVTVVSLTLDDGSASQYVARSILASHGMKATFFVSSELVGNGSYYMTSEQVRDLAADGHEIGGHTLTHVELKAVGEAERRRQVCDDREHLIRLGFSAASFAYPYSVPDPTVERVVKECGYKSGRGLGGVGKGCGADCPPAESIPPPDPYSTRTLPPIEATTPLSEMKRWVVDAEANGGGWLQFVFHNICDGCKPSAIKQSDFAALLDWLKPRASKGTIVKTVGQALSGYFSVQPKRTASP